MGAVCSSDKAIDTRHRPEAALGKLSALSTKGDDSDASSQSTPASGVVPRKRRGSVSTYLNCGLCPADLLSCSSAPQCMRYEDFTSFYQGLYLHITPSLPPPPQTPQAYEFECCNGCIPLFPRSQASLNARPYGKLRSTALSLAQVSAEVASPCVRPSDRKVVEKTGAVKERIRGAIKHSFILTGKQAARIVVGQRVQS